MKEVLLIGAVHRDPDGAYRLRKILQYERPTAVAVEVSAYGLSYRRKNSRRLLRLLRRRLKRLTSEPKRTRRGWGPINAIEAQLQIPFEYHVPLRYCRDSGAKLACIDSSLWSRRHIHEKWEQLLSSENLAILIKQFPNSHVQVVAEEYKIAALLLTRPQQPLLSAFMQDCSADPEWQHREMELAEALEGMYASLHKGKLAYVGGWQHLVGPEAGGTLYERLIRLQPRRVLLSHVWGK